MGASQAIITGDQLAIGGQHVPGISAVSQRNTDLDFR